MLSTLLIAPSITFAQDQTSDGDTSGQLGDDGFARRFRWGITGGGGPMVGGYSGFGVGLEARFGMQFTPLLGVYAQPTLLAGAGARADIDSAEATGVALYGLGVLAEADLMDLFFVGAGPELLGGGFASAQVSASESGANGNLEAATGPFFGVATRAGLVLGSSSPTHRGGFSLGIDWHFLFVSDDVLMMPMVFLGYDSF